MNTTETGQLSEWKKQHRDALAAAFSQAFGSQVHEWHDFVEQAYADHLAKAGEASPPAP